MFRKIIGKAIDPRAGRILTHLRTICLIPEYLPDAIRTECSRCDERQRDSAVRVLKFLDDKHPDLLRRLLRKFDPNHEYETRFRERLLARNNKSSA